MTRTTIKLAMNDISVSAHFVTAALGGARRKNFDTEAMLRAADIPPELIQDPQARVSGHQYTLLMQTIWATMQDEFMGFMESPSKPGTFATMCYLVIRCHNLRAVFQRASAFYNLFEKPLYLALSEQDELATLTIETEAQIYDPHHFLQESLLVIWHRLACWLTGHQIELTTSCFSYPAPNHVKEYRHLFNSPLQFNQPKTGISFHKRYLDLPVLRDERALKQFLKTSPADLLAKPDGSSTYAARIRAIISRDFNVTVPDFEQIAQQINVSPQTLRRRLKEENTSYQEIKDQLRRDIAIHHLSRNELSINDIALRVGFTEPSTFHRAFKKWTGMTPGAYRAGAER